MSKTHGHTQAVKLCANIAWVEGEGVRDLV